MLPVRYIFMSPIPENRRVSVLIFKKSQTQNLQISLFYLKEQSPKEKIWNSVLLNKILGPKNGQNWFYPWWRQKLFYLVSLKILLLNKQRKKNFFQVQPLKIFNSNFFVVADFRVAGKTFWGLAPEKWYFGFGVLQFFSEKSLHPTPHTWPLTIDHLYLGKINGLINAASRCNPQFVSNGRG